MVVRNILLFSAYIFTTFAISCQNQYNYDVSWFAAYKMPQMQGEPSGSAEGYGFYYLDVDNRKEFKPSPVALSLDHQAIGYTLAPYYNRINDPELLHVFYNDEHALNSSDLDPVSSFDESNVNPKFSNLASVEKGHTKGVLLFDKDAGSGIWLIHSVPKFPAAYDKYEYPVTGTEYGQQFLCLTLDLQTLGQLGTVLFYNHPDIYSYRVPDWAKDISPDLVKVVNGQYNKDENATHLQQPLPLKDPNSVPMEVFAKTHLLNDDLWAALVAPAYGALEVETWRRGYLIDPDCDTPNPVYDAQEIKVGGSAEFKYTKDHSKYARTLEQKNGKVCIGDINRMTSQFKRGGGTVCIQDPDLYNAYSTIKEVLGC